MKKLDMFCDINRSF